MPTRKPKAEARNRLVYIRVTNAEHATLTRAAAPYPLASWARFALIDAAEAKLKEKTK